MSIQLEPNPQLLPAQVRQDKPSSFCGRFAYGIANCVKKFSLGVTAAGITIPLQLGINYIGQLGGVIPIVTRENNIRKMVANFHNMGLKNFSVEALLNATCYVEEFTKQLNSHFPSPMHTTPLNYKIQNIFHGSLFGPFMEEVSCRGLIQDVLLTRVPKFVARKIAPGREAMFDSTVAKAIRIVLTAAAFSFAHLDNKGEVSEEYLTAQLVTTFISGIGFGVVKESKAGLLGSISAHMANNFALTSAIWGSC